MTWKALTIKEAEALVERSCEQAQGEISCYEAWLSTLGADRSAVVRREGSPAPGGWTKPYAVREFGWVCSAHHVLLSEQKYPGRAAAELARDLGEGLRGEVPLYFGHTEETHVRVEPRSDLEPFDR